MHDLRQGDLARFIGLSPTGLANILSGRHEPTLRTAGRAASAFGITIEELCGDRNRCLRAAVAAFDTAPIRNAGSAPVAAVAAQA
jgi:DNA-binding XRE family transcriptional regulator